VNRCRAITTFLLLLYLCCASDSTGEIIVAECGTLRTEGECHYFDGFDTGSYSIRDVPGGVHPDTVFAWGWTANPTTCPPGPGCLRVILLGECVTRDWGCGVISDDCGDDECRCIAMDSGELVALVDDHGFVPGDRVHLVGYSLEGWATFCSYQYLVSAALLESCHPPMTRPTSWGHVKSVYR